MSPNDNSSVTYLIPFTRNIEFLPQYLSSNYLLSLSASRSLSPPLISLKSKSGESPNHQLLSHFSTPQINNSSLTSQLLRSTTQILIPVTHLFHLSPSRRFRRLRSPLLSSSSVRRSVKSPGVTAVGIAATNRAPKLRDPSRRQFSSSSLPPLSLHSLIRRIHSGFSSVACVQSRRCSDPLEAMPPSPSAEV